MGINNEMPCCGENRVYLTNMYMFDNLKMACRCRYLTYETTPESSAWLHMSFQGLAPNITVEVQD